jgi:hypothetical protein
VSAIAQASSRDHFVRRNGELQAKRAFFHIGKLNTIISELYAFNVRRCLVKEAK